MLHQHDQTSADRRLPGLDAGRVVAATGIVFTHWIASSEAVWLRPIALIGVPFFLATAALLTVRQSFEGRAAGVMFGARVRRIVVPWVVWSAIYFVLTYGISGWLLGGHAPRPPLVDYVDGFGGHLWFLPLVFLVGVVCVVAGLAARRSSRWSAAVVLASLAGGGVLLAATSPGTNNLDRWPYELPVACLALAFAVAERRGWVRVPTSAVVGIAALVTVVALIVWQIRFGELPARRACQAAGVALLAAGLAMPRTLVPAWLARLGKLSYGVYISHTVLILALHRVLGGRGALPTEALLGLFPLVATGSFVFAWMLKRAPGFRRAMP